MVKNWCPIGSWKIFFKSLSFGVLLVLRKIFLIKLWFGPWKTNSLKNSKKNVFKKSTFGSWVPEKKKYLKNSRLVVLLNLETYFLKD